MHMDPTNKRPIIVPAGFYWVRRSLPDGSTAVQPAELLATDHWQLLGDDRWYPYNSPDIVVLRALPVPSDI